MVVAREIPMAGRATLILSFNPALGSGPDCLRRGVGLPVTGEVHRLMRPKCPMDLWTSPSDRHALCAPWGQPVDNAGALPTAGCDASARSTSSSSRQCWHVMGLLRPGLLVKSIPYMSTVLCLVYLAQTARTCIYGHLEERNANDHAVSHLEMDDNVPGREHELGRPRHAMSVMPALAL